MKRIPLKSTILYGKKLGCEKCKAALRHLRKECFKSNIHRAYGFRVDNCYHSSRKVEKFTAQLSICYCGSCERLKEWSDEQNEQGKKVTEQKNNHIFDLMLT